MQTGTKPKNKGWEPTKRLTSPAWLGARLYVSRAFKSGVSLGLEDLTTTIEAGWADVVTQVDFTSCRLDCSARCIQGIVRTVHTTLRGRLFILLNSHDGLRYE